MIQRIKPIDIKETVITNWDNKKIDILTKVNEGDNIVIQFDSPTYSKKMLSSLNKLCERFEDKINVRFHGFQGKEFDFNVLNEINKVKSLTIDCMTNTSIVNISALYKLSSIERLEIDIGSLNKKDLLFSKNLYELEKLAIGENGKDNIDLSVLENYYKLSDLSLIKQTANTNTIGKLSNLKKLLLGSFPKSVKLSFINQLKNLSVLKIIFGSRDSIEEVENINVQYLELLHVNSLEKLGDLSRFKNLREILITDQAKVTEIKFSTNCNNLEKVIIQNCKQLKQIVGLNNLTSLKKLHIASTEIDLELLIKNGLPGDIENIHFSIGKKKVDQEYRKRIEAIGYNSDACNEAHLRQW